MEHFFDARGLMPIVPRWLPFPLFWTYLVGVALFAAAVSFLAWRCVRPAAWSLALLFLIIVVTVDLPGTLAAPHDRIAWTLTARELAFASGPVVLATCFRSEAAPIEAFLRAAAQILIAGILIFYGVEHFLFSRFVIGVPLEKPIPAWMPLRAGIASVIGAAEVLGGIGMLFATTRRRASAAAGFVLLCVTIFFYGPLLAAELRTNPLEGINYLSDTLLFAGTVLLAGMARHPVPGSSPAPA